MVQHSCHIRKLSTYKLHIWKLKTLQAAFSEEKIHQKLKQNKKCYLKNYKLLPFALSYTLFNF